MKGILTVPLSVPNSLLCTFSDLTKRSAWSGHESSGSPAWKKHVRTDESMSSTVDTFNWAYPVDSRTNSWSTKATNTKGGKTNGSATP